MYSKNKIFSFLLLSVISLSLLIPLASAELESVKVSYGYEVSGRSVEFSPDNQHIAIGYDNGAIRIWDTLNGENIGFDPEYIDKYRLMSLFGSTEPSLSKIKYSPDGRYLLTTSYEYDFWGQQATSAYLIVHDIESGEVIRYHNMTTPALWDIAISADGKTYAALSEMDPENETSTISLWDMDTGNLVDTIESNNWEATSIAFTPDNKSLIVSFLNRKNPDRIVIFDLDTGLETKVIKERSVANIQFSDDGRIFAAGGTIYGEVIVWNSSNYEEVLRIRHINHPSEDIALSSDGELLVVVEGSSLMAWNLSAKKQILNMDSLIIESNHASYDQVVKYQCIDISNDNKYVAVVAWLDDDSKYHLDSDTFSESFGTLNDDIEPSYSGDVVFIYDVQDIKTNVYKENFFDFILRLGRTWESWQRNMF